MFLFFVIYSILSFYIGVKKPTFYVIFYLFSSTKFLGFFGLDDLFVFGSYAVGYFTLNLITFLSIFFSGSRLFSLNGTTSFIVTIVIFILYGIIYPLLLGESTFSQALIGGQNFLFFSIFGYLACYYKKIDFKKVLNVLWVLGILLAIIYIAYYLFLVAPPFYIKEGFNSIKVYFPTFISFGVFLNYYLRHIKNISRVLALIVYVILFLGIAFSGHLSVFGGTVLGLILLSGIVNTRRNIFRFIFKVSSLALLFSIFLLVFPITFKLIENELLSDASNSINSREIVNHFRWSAIEKKPFRGYGFLHHSTDLSRNLIPDTSNIYMQQLHSIDSGYLDLLIKFGFIGTTIYLLIWLSLIRRSLIDANNILGISMGCFLATYFIINYTWSVFSYAHGLLPGFIAVFLIILSKNKLYSEASIEFSSIHE